MLIEIAAVSDLLLFASAWARRRRAQRCQSFMGKGHSIHLPIVDDYLKRQTASASRVEIFAASQITSICRRAVQTRSFESLLLYGIRSSVQRRNNRQSNWRIIL